MIKIASIDDFSSCLELLKKLGPIKHVTPEYLHLTNEDNGFSIIVESERKAIALSTFTIRECYKANKLNKILYWENLVVDEAHRDGIAYILIFAHLKKLLKKNVIDDVYFIVRRKNALKIHKSAKFKTFGYIGIIPKKLSIKYWKKVDKNIEYVEYSDLIETISKNATVLDLSLFKGFEMSSLELFKRQINNKNGYVIFDHRKKRLSLIRSLVSNWLFEVNLLIPGDKIEYVPGSLVKRKSLFTLTFGFIDIEMKNKLWRAIFPRLVYEGLTLTGVKSLSDFQIWEHDAW